MSDTAITEVDELPTTSQTADRNSSTDEIKRAPAPRDVNYEITEVDELPESGRSGGRSVLEEQLAKVAEDVNAGTKSPDKWYMIGSYRVQSAAGAAKTQLTKRHGGKAMVEGWEFAAKKMENGRTGLFVRYNPSAIVEGGWDAWKAEQEQARKRREEAKSRREAKAEKEAEAAKEQTSPNAKKDTSKTAAEEKVAERTTAKNKED